MKSYAASLGRNCNQNNIPALAAGIARIQRRPNQSCSLPHWESSNFNIPLTLLNIFQYHNFPLTFRISGAVPQHDARELSDGVGLVFRAGELFGRQVDDGNPVTPSVAGTWEFLAVSNNGGGTTGIEVALVSSRLICWTCSVGPAGALTQTLFGNQPL
jgi:hypothetical protein